MWTPRPLYFPSGKHFSLLRGTHLKNLTFRSPGHTLGIPRTPKRSPEVPQGAPGTPKGLPGTPHGPPMDLPRPPKDRWGHPRTLRGSSGTPRASPRDPPGAPQDPQRAPPASPKDAIYIKSTLGFLAASLNSSELPILRTQYPLILSTGPAECA